MVSLTSLQLSTVIQDNTGYITRNSLPSITLTQVHQNKESVPSKTIEMQYLLLLKNYAQDPLYINPFSCRGLTSSYKG